MQDQRAFSLWELFIVVTILCVLLALLVPAIEAARDAARRMSCSNNFRQIGLSIHNYYAAYRRCPSAMFGTDANQQRLSGLIALTPFIDASTFWERVSNPSTYNDVAYPSMGPVPWDTNYEPWCTAYATFRCPADGAQGPELGRTNYAFCVADRVADLYPCKTRDDARGFFAPGIALSFVDITDGLSNTIAMTEIGSAHGRKLQGQFAIGRGVGLADAPSACLKVVDPQQPLFYAESVTLGKIGRGGAFADGAGGYSLVHTILPPDSPSCGIGSKDPLSGVFSAGSYHQGGCHILMGDGAVIFITTSIDSGDPSHRSPATVDDPSGAKIRSPYGLWGALGTRADGEILDEQVSQ